MTEAPWHEELVRTSDGLDLCVRDWGPAGGRPLVAHHGTPSSRLSGIGTQDDRLASGIRLLTFDRPGCGRSSPRPGRAVADAARDVETIADAFGLDRVAVCGWSGGGPHALACGALLPGRVTRVLTLGSPAPGDDPTFDFVAGMPEASVVEFRAAMRGRDALATVVEPYLAEDDVLGEWLDALPPSDRAVLGRLGAKQRQQEIVQEGCRQGARGWLDDDLALVAPWGFALESISVPVWLWHCEDDVLVPGAHGRYLVDRIPGAQLELVPEAGHWLDEHHRTMLRWLAGDDAVAGPSGASRARPGSRAVESARSQP